MNDLMPNNGRQFLLAIAALLTTSASVYYIILTKRRRAIIASNKGYKEIPSPKGLFYAGHLFSLTERPGIKVTEWQRELGPVIRLKMGIQTWVMISDPQIAHEIFVTRGMVTSDRPYHSYSSDFYSHGGKGIVFANADKRWKKARAATLTVLAPQRVNEYTDVFIHEADACVQRLLDATEANGTLDPIASFQTSSLNVIMTVCFAKRFTSADDPRIKELTYFVNTTIKLSRVQGDISGCLPILSFLDVLFGKRRKFYDFVTKSRNPAVIQLIKEACASNKKCLVKRFLALKEEFGLDDQDILVIMSDLIVAGTDTLSVSMYWLTAILTHHPDIQRKLREELDAFIRVHGRLPSFEERNQVPYLIATQKESLRFCPVSPFGLLHLATKDIVVRDYLIPKGTVLASNMLGMHHLNPDVYPEPEKFKPERFMDNTRTMSAAANGNINQRDHYNFGWGRRVCPGIHFAEVEMFYLFAKIIAHCVIAPQLDKHGKEMPVDLRATRGTGIVALPAPYQVRFIRRKDSLLK